MKFTDEQKDLLAFLPNALKNSNELTDSAKLVLGNIIFLYGMEDAQKNGYVYRTNTKMMEEINIKSEHTLIGAVRLLELLGYIETKRGKRNEASTYKLLKNCSKKCSNKCSNNSENCSNEIETLQNQVLLLQKQVVLLQKEIENLKNCSKKCSTDTDIDKEININYTTGTKDINDSRRMVTEEKEKINKKESCNGDSLQSGTTEDNTKTDFNNSSSGDGESTQSSTDEWDSAVFGTPPVEEDLHISIGISNNCAGHALTPQMEQLPTNDIKTRQNAQECPQIEFDEKWYNDTYALMDYFKTLEDLDELYNRLKQCKNKRMIMDFKYKVWHSYDLNDSNLQNRAMQIVTELTRMRA